MEGMLGHIMAPLAWLAGVSWNDANKVGALLEARAPDGRGSVSRPLPVSEIVEKFRDNAGRALTPARIDEIERAVLALDTLADVRSLAALCRA